jgi:hypothetical protein
MAAFQEALVALVGSTPTTPDRAGRQARRMPEPRTNLRAGPLRAAGIRCEARPSVGGGAVPW